LAPNNRTRTITSELLVFFSCISSLVHFAALLSEKRSPILFSLPRNGFKRALGRTKTKTTFSD